MRNYHYAKAGEVMYHTGLTKEQLAGARYAVVPGDPGRVPGLAKALDPSAVFLTSHRDYTSWLARVSGEPVLVMSTGMGGPCMSFAVEELARLGVTTFLRVGTTGSIQEGLELGDLVIDRASVRRDGASKAYAPAEYPAVADMTVTLALMKAAESLRVPHQVGISVSTDSFWPGVLLSRSFQREREDRRQGHIKAFHMGDRAFGGKRFSGPQKPVFFLRACRRGGLSLRELRPVRPGDTGEDGRRHRGVEAVPFERQGS